MHMATMSTTLSAVMLVGLLLADPCQAFSPALGKYQHQWRSVNGRTTGRQSPAARRPASEKRVALRMADGDKEPQKEEEKGLMKKMLASFDDENSGEGNSPLERAGNYVFDLITVTLGAAVFTCLALNFMVLGSCTVFVDMFG